MKTLLFAVTIGIILLICAKFIATEFNRPMPLPVPAQINPVTNVSETALSTRLSKLENATIESHAAPAPLDLVPPAVSIPAPLAENAPPPVQMKVPSPKVKKSADAVLKPLDAPLIPVPLAREALSLVGVDSGAEEVWRMAINDPNTPKNVRKDLIEDLNEDGFVDPKHLTEEDVPLILSRLELIEQIAPEAMDETNDAAFAEAYKDLVDMLNKLTPQ